MDHSPRTTRPWKARAGLVWSCVALTACGVEVGEDLDPSLIHSVERGDLAITVRERCEIQAAKDTRVSSQLEGRATLIYLIDEGTVVEAGQKVAEMDVSQIEEKRALQAIAVAKAQGALEQARKNVEIVEKELRAAVKTAETRLQIAHLQLEKFIGQPIDSADGDSSGTNAAMLAALRELLADESSASDSDSRRPGIVEKVLEILGPEQNLTLEMGEMANQILQQIGEISLVRADLELANETLFHSRKLEQKGFITSNELERDEINYKRELSKLTVAWNNLMLLVNYTLPETLLGLELEVENAGLALESVAAANEARRVRENSELESIEAEHALAGEQLENYERQIEFGVLRAPAPGLVVYGRWDWDEPVYEGMEVRERQEVVILPDVSTMMAEIKVPEAQIGKLAEGQKASIEVDAFPNRHFSGRVSYVSTLPDPAPRRQVLKLYVVRVLIDGDNSLGELRPGMNGRVTIEVGNIEDVLSAPLPALERSSDAHFVWKVTPGGPIPVQVELGGNNLTHVEIVAGLREGDRIYMVRPPGAQLPSSESAQPAADPEQGELVTAGGGVVSE